MNHPLSRAERIQRRHAMMKPFGQGFKKYEPPSAEHDIPVSEVWSFVNPLETPKEEMEEPELPKRRFLGGGIVPPAESFSDSSNPPLKRSLLIPDLKSSGTVGVGGKTETTTASSSEETRPQNVKSELTALRISNLSGYGHKTEIMEWILSNSRLKVSFIYVSECLSFAFVGFFRKVDGEELKECLDRRPHRHQILEVQWM